MSKEYNVKLQKKLEDYLEAEGLSQAKAAPILGISAAVLSQYRRSVYDKGDIGEVEKKLEEFFRIKEEQGQNSRKAEPFRANLQGYIPTSISEAAYKLIRYCQLEKGIVVIDGDAGIGKPSSCQVPSGQPIHHGIPEGGPQHWDVKKPVEDDREALKLPENQRTEDLSFAIQDKLKETDKIIIIDEAQNLKFMALEEIRGWVDEDPLTGKPGIGIVLIGNVEVYNKMLGRQEAIFSQQFNRTRLHGRYRTTDIKREDVVKLLPALEERRMTKEIDYLHSISRSKWGIRGMVNVFRNAVNDEDVSMAGLERVAGTMGIRFI